MPGKYQSEIEGVGQVSECERIVQILVFFGEMWMLSVESSCTKIFALQPYLVTPFSVFFFSLKAGFVVSRVVFAEFLVMKKCEHIGFPVI